MTAEEKYAERLATIRQILEKTKMNPDFEDLDRIYKLTEDLKNDNI